jgi:hypothetical protein
MSTGSWLAFRQKSVWHRQVARANSTLQRWDRYQAIFQRTALVTHQGGGSKRRPIGKCAPASRIACAQPTQSILPFPANDLPNVIVDVEVTISSKRFHHRIRPWVRLGTFYKLRSRSLSEMPTADAHVSPDFAERLGRRVLWKICCAANAFTFDKIDEQE